MRLVDEAFDGRNLLSVAKLLELGQCRLDLRNKSTTFRPFDLVKDFLCSSCKYDVSFQGEGGRARTNHIVSILVSY